MGPMEVPAEAYYGASTQRAVLNFPVSGLRFNRGFIRVLGLIKMAAARVNAELGLLDPKLADAIAQAVAYRYAHATPTPMPTVLGEVQEPAALPATGQASMGKERSWGIYVTLGFALLLGASVLVGLSRNRRTRL